MGEAATVTNHNVEGHAAITLASAGAELQATFLPALGMLGCSLRHRGEELLALPGGLARYAQHGSAMGIPLLHPWANRLGDWNYDVLGRNVTIDHASTLVHRDDGGLPIHGLLAASPHWTIAEVDADDEGARLRAELEFGDHPDLLAAFPFPHRLTLDVGVAATTLTIRAAVTPTGEVAVPVSFGFHPYLTLPASARADWQISLPVRRRLVLDARSLPSGASEPLRDGISGALGERTFDDCYDELASPPLFAVADDRRRVELELGEGYEVAQVFAPPGSDFICFEPMTAPIDALRSGDGLRLAAPGEPFEAAFTITAAAAS